MNNSLFSILGETTIVVIFYFTIYYIFMRNGRHFVLNRMFLLFSMVFALVYPFIKITIPVVSQTVVPVIMQKSGIALSVYEAKEAAGSESTISIIDVIKYIYYTGVLTFFILFLIKLTRIISLITNEVKVKKDNYYLIKSQKTGAPLSFFKYIVIPDNQYNESEIESIIMHESNHIRQFHTVDLILSEIFKAIQWFNPVSWLYNRELQNIHEFLADKYVIINGINKTEYLSLLIFNTNEYHAEDICNNFNLLITKKRIKMIMDTQKKSAASWLRIMPAALLTFCLLAAHTSYTQQSVIKEKKPEKIITDSENITYVVDGKVVKNISDIPMENIESISICKDKKFFKSYGDQYGTEIKSDGIIIIERKKVSENKNKFSYNIDKTQQSVANKKDTQPVNKKWGGIEKKQADKKNTENFVGGMNGKNATYIVDGKEVGNFDDVPADNIESFLIYKDKESFKALEDKYGINIKGNGVVIVTTKKNQNRDTLQSISREKNTESLFIRGIDNKNITYIVDGKEVENFTAIHVDTVESFSVYKDKELFKALEDEYGIKIKDDGVVVLTTKKNRNNDTQQSIREEKKPEKIITDSENITYVVDGKVVKNISDIPMENIESISICKDKKFFKSYGDRYGTEIKSDGIIMIERKKAYKDKELFKALDDKYGITIKGESISICKDKKIFKSYGDQYGTEIKSDGIIMIERKKAS